MVRQCLNRSAMETLRKTEKCRPMFNYTLLNVSSRLYTTVQLPSQLQLEIVSLLFHILNTNFAAESINSIDFNVLNLTKTALKIGQLTKFPNPKLLTREAYPRVGAVVIENIELPRWDELASIHTGLYLCTQTPQDSNLLHIADYRSDVETLELRVDGVESADEVLEEEVERLRQTDQARGRPPWRQPPGPRGSRSTCTCCCHCYWRQARGETVDRLLRVRREGGRGGGGGGRDREDPGGGAMGLEWRFVRQLGASMELGATEGKIGEFPTGDLTGYGIVWSILCVVMIFHLWCHRFRLSRCHGNGVWRHWFYTTEWAIHAWHDCTVKKLK